MSNTPVVTDTTRTLGDYQNQQRLSKQTLDKDAFMRLLIEQMANQDPLNPSDNGEYMAQLTQFSILEQLQSLNGSMTQTQLYSLVGKHVYVNGIDADGQAQLLYGKVDGVIKQDGIDFLIIGDQKFRLSDLVGVADVEEPKATADTITNTTGLLGKTISALLDDETVTGTVSKLFSREGIVYALVNEREIPVSSITEIA